MSLNRNRCHVSSSVRDINNTDPSLPGAGDTGYMDNMGHTILWRRETLGGWGVGGGGGV